MTFLLSLILIASIIGLIYLFSRLSRLKKTSVQKEAELQKQAVQYRTDLGKQIDLAKKLEAENQRLSKWEIVADADDKAKELLQSAQELFEKTKTDAVRLAESSQQQATILITEAKQQTKSMKDEAKVNLDASTIRASKIIDEANKKAEEIAGSAYEAMKNSNLYEQTVQAMKNIIEGYGDQYLIPGYSLLDDLAKDFGHTAAGQELKSARERTKAMIRTGTAATCDYVEKNRRDTAVNFVVDAFNGKVDSILSRVRNDNAGKLDQEIKDAFTLVNYNGKAFRSARILEEYLTACL